MICINLAIVTIAVVLSLLTLEREKLSPISYPLIYTLTLRVHTHAYSHTHMYFHTHVETLMHKHTHTHTYTHTLRHTHTCTLTCTHRHTCHTHTHTQSRKCKGGERDCMINPTIMLLAWCFLHATHCQGSSSIITHVPSYGPHCCDRIT